MIIKIEGHIPVSSIQEEFSKNYPFLKLEFFHVPHQASEPSAKKEMMKSDVLVSKLQKKEKKGYIEIIPPTKVLDMKAIFRNQHGLHVQVVISSCELWLQTSGSDNITLVEHHIMG